MSYTNDIFVDNCIMRLVQLAAAIRQNNDALARQEFDRMEKEFDRMEKEFDRMEKELDAEELDSMERELDGQYFDIENNA